MEKMKDKKIEKDIIEVIKLTKQLNILVLKLRKEDVSIMFDIDHSMQPSEYIKVSKASQKPFPVVSTQSQTPSLLKSNPLQLLFTMLSKSKDASC